MRGVGGTRPAGKAKEKVTEERVNMEAKKEDLEERVRMAPNMGPVAHTPRPCRIRERER